MWYFASCADHVSTETALHCKCYALPSGYVDILKAHMHLVCEVSFQTGRSLLHFHFSLKCFKSQICNFFHNWSIGLNLTAKLVWHAL